MVQHRKDFEYDGRKLSAQATEIGGGYEVKVYEEGSPVGRVTYTVTWEVKTDMAMKGYDALGLLLQTAQDDFVRSSDWLKTHNADGTLKKTDL